MASYFVKVYHVNMPKRALRLEHDTQKLMLLEVLYYLEVEYLNFDGISLILTIKKEMVKPEYFDYILEMGFKEIKI